MNSAAASALRSTDQPAPPAPEAGVSAPDAVPAPTAATAAAATAPTAATAAAVHDVHAQAIDWDAALAAEAAACEERAEKRSRVAVAAGPCVRSGSSAR